MKYSFLHVAIMFLAGIIGVAAAKHQYYQALDELNTSKKLNNAIEWAMRKQDVRIIHSQKDIVGLVEHVEKKGKGKRPRVYLCGEGLAARNPKSKSWCIWTPFDHECGITVRAESGKGWSLNGRGATFIGNENPDEAFDLWKRCLSEKED